MNSRIRNGVVAATALLLLGSVFACRKEEQAVKGVAQRAVKAEHRAQAAALKRDRNRAELERIPVPAKSLYADVHNASRWQNPFLTVGVKTLDLRFVIPKSSRKDNRKQPRAGRQDVRVRLAGLDKTLAAIPPGAWRYGRVIAVAESPRASPGNRPAVRRNVEDVIRDLNSLGVVVEEWPPQ